MDKVVANTLLCLLRKGIGLKTKTANLSQIDPETWSLIYKLACRQGVQAIAWDGLQHFLHSEQTTAEPSIQMSRELKLCWALSCESIERKYAHQREVIAILLEFYKRQDIRTMLLKGYGLSLLYPLPSHRPCGDIDIYLYGEQRRADELIASAKGITVRTDKHHHTVFYIDGVMVENHYDFINNESHFSNRKIEAQLHQMLNQASESIDVDGQIAFLPPPQLNALFLLRHSAMHFAAINISLRHLIDWSLFVQHYGRQVDWGKIESIARKQRMDKFLHCLNAIAIDQFGLDASILPKFERDKDLEARVLDEILSPGFDSREPEHKRLVAWTIYRTRRWWANRWKHQMVYREGLLMSFLIQLRCHLIKPRGYKKS